jgi:hypothetical protein
MRRGVEEPGHRPGDACLVALAGVEQRQALQRGEMPRPDFDLHQHPTMAASLPECFTPLPSLFTALIVCGCAHRVIEFPARARC